MGTTISNHNHPWRRRSEGGFTRLELLDQYRLDVGHYPSTEQGLAALVTKPEDEAKWQGPYLKKSVPLDPWGHAYSYKIPGEHGDFDIWSFGKDAQPGGTAENEDITNW